MKKTERQELQTKTTVQLQKMLGDLQLELTKAQLQKSAGKLANTSLVKTLADDLARIKTAMRMKELTAVTEPETKS